MSYKIISPMFTACKLGLKWQQHYFFRSKYIASDNPDAMIVTNNYFDVRNTHLPRLSQLVRWCLMIMCKNDLKEINVSHRHHMFKKGYFYNVTVSSLIPIIKVQRTGRDDELKHQDFRGARTQCSEIGGKCAIQFRAFTRRKNNAAPNEKRKK